MLKKFPSDKINGTKNALFFLSRVPSFLSVLQCIAFCTRNTFCKCDNYNNEILEGLLYEGDITTYFIQSQVKAHSSHN